MMPFLPPKVWVTIFSNIETHACNDNNIRYENYRSFCPKEKKHSGYSPFSIFKVFTPHENQTNVIGLSLQTQILC